MINTLTFSLRSLRRDWRSGELRILAIAVVIAVASMTAVGFFTDRTWQAMGQQVGELLAADLVLTSTNPIGSDRLAYARTSTLQTAQTLNFRSVVIADGKMQLVEVKAVSADYPLRGSLRVAPKLFAPDDVTLVTPGRAEVWVNADLLQKLRVHIDDVISLGEAEFLIRKVLTYEPDRGGELFNIAPRVMMNIEDVPATRLLQPGSRARHMLLVAGTDDSVRAYRSWLTSRLNPDERLATLEDGRPELRTALERAQRFLGLASLVSVFLAGVAMAMAARRYTQRHLDTSAIMRCLGATQRTIIKIFAWEMFWIGLVAGLLGCLLGYVAQTGLALILAGLVATELPLPSLRPALVGLPLGLAVLMGFALPPLLALKDVSPTRVLRRQVTTPVPRNMATYALAFLTMAGLMSWHARDLGLLAYVLGGAVGTVVVLAMTAYLLVKLLNGLRGRVGVAWRFGLANISRRAHVSMAQIVAFGLGIMVLLLLSLIRGDLLEGWRKTIPPEAPNHFLINIQPDQAQALGDFLAAHGTAKAGIYPMVRARLVSINGRRVEPKDFDDPRAQHLARHEYNLSWAAQLRVDNRVVSGRWWSADEHGQPLMSFEQELAATLGIKLGDVLTFDIAGSKLDTAVTNLRTVDWDTFNVNFFTILPPGVLNEYPATYVTSVYLSPEGRRILTPMLERFPNVTVIDVDALLGKVRQIMERVSLAVEYVFIFTLLAGLAVLYAAIQSTQDERRYETAVLRILGAHRGQLLRGLVAEFVTLGLLAGALAGVAASIIGYALAEFVFHFDYRLNLWVWLAGAVCGAIGIGVAGTLGTRSVLRQPPAKTLREV